MNRLSYNIIFFFLFFSSPAFTQYQPQKDLQELFVDVQLKPVFPDSKTFVDALPKYPIKEILKKYRKEKGNPNFDLSQFVKENFTIPKNAVSSKTTTYPPIETHIENLWEQLVRKDTETEGSLIELPHPYIVPGGRFNEMYYWDSYFTLLGLQVSGKEQLIQDMVDNFAWLIDQYGFIPNGTRTYYLSRSQPPFFALIVDLLAELKGEQIYQKYLPQLLAEHQFWMSGAETLSNKNNAHKRVVRLEDSSILNRYWDNDTLPRPEAYKEDIETASLTDVKTSTTYRNIRAAAESGWDFSGRWFRDGVSLETIHTTEIIPVDLNSLLYFLEKTIAKAYKLSNKSENSKEFSLKAKARKEGILKYCWNNQQGFFMDYDFVAQQPTGFYSLAAMTPLFFDFAEKEQAAKVADNIGEHFLFPGGLPSTLLLTGQQWDAPNGWAPLQWISYKGLKNYGYDSLANSLKTRWLETVLDEYQESGKLLEKYNVVYPEIPGGGGEYPTQDGFGWTNGVYLKMIKEE